MRRNENGTGLALSSLGLLNQRAVPALLPEQLRRFTAKALQARSVRRFDAREVLAGLQARDGSAVLAVDIGGDKLSASYFSVREGDVHRVSDVLTRQGDDGVGYLDALREVGEFARRERLPVGISFAGPTEGTRLLAGPNLPVFVAELAAGYGGDFANLFPEIEVANDAEAGIIAGALEAVRRYPDARDVIYIINGSGLGGSVLTGDVIYAAEPGHIAVDDDLNIFRQRKYCGLGGAPYVCLEAVAASKAGIEDVWLQQTGEPLTGHEIAARYLHGHQVAFELYDNSAHILAHAVKGMAAVFKLLADPRRLVVVGHGGIFNVPGYGERLRAILENDLGYAPRIMFTRNFSHNTCLEGAAIAVSERFL